MPGGGCYFGENVLVKVKNKKKWKNESLRFRNSAELLLPTKCMVQFLVLDRQDNF
jgi:hypothetical protein